MQPEKPVPNYKLSGLASGWYYCLHCHHALATEYSMRTHVRTIHGVDDPSEAVDYTNGVHLRILIERWRAYSDFLIENFERSVESLRGADDLIHEVGDGVPDEVYPITEYEREKADEQLKLDPDGGDGA